MNVADTIVAVSTPAGPGERGIVRLSGPEAEAIVARVARGNLEFPRGNYTAVAAEFPLDDCVVPATVYVMRGPRSYTREDVIEIHSFGAPVLLQALLDRVMAAGARLAGPGEFTRRAFLNGRLDLTQAEAVQAVVMAAGEAEYRAAQSALSGVVARRIRSVRADLVSLVAWVEVSLDFSDQDVEIIAFAEVAARARRIRDALDELLSSAPEGRLPSHNVRVVIYGPPNAGKSSIFNALLRTRRAIVSDEPHTTRDALEAEISLAGRTATLVDTAGLHSSDDEVSAAAVAQTEAAVSSADIRLCVLDGTVSPGEEEMLALRFASGPNCLVLLNKSDLGPCDGALGASLPPAVDRLRVSAMTGAGVSQIVEWLSARIESGRVQRLPGDLMLNARQAALVRDAVGALNRAVQARPDEAEQHMELVAADLNDALRALSEITGDAFTADVLDRIFSDFCIGK